MSSNLLKQMYTVVSQDQKRVIDMNALAEEKLAALAKEQKHGSTGSFVAGLNAEKIDVLPGAEEEDLSPEELLKRAKEEAQQILEQAAAEAQSKIADAQVQALNLQKDAQAQAEIEKGRILEQAKQQGYQEGSAKAQAQADAVKREYAQKEKQLEAYYQQQLDELEPKFVDVITDVYAHVLGVEVTEDKDIIAHLISNTIRNIDGGHSFIIHVSQEDYPFVSMQKKQLMAGATAASSTVEVVEDLAMAQGECTIETDGGIFDCGLGTQLSELKKKLMLLAYSKED